MKTYDQFSMPFARELAIKKKVEEIGGMLLNRTITVSGAFIRLSWAKYWINTAFDDEIVDYLNDETANN